MIIECDGITKRYGSAEALRGLTFTVESGGCVGFLGPNGAGKTTAIRILTGLARPNSGRVAVNGFDVVRDRSKVCRIIGYLPQAPVFYNYMTALESVLWTAELFGIPKQKARSRSEELLRLLGLWAERQRTVGGYSGGMKQRLGIAHALINDPRIVFLDEPVSALDPLGRSEILDLIQQVKARTTVFMSSHVLGDVERVSDRVVIVNKGRVAADAAVEELRDRYATDVFEIETAHGDPDIGDVLRHEPYVTSVAAFTPGHYRVAVSDLGMARRLLPKVVLHSGATLLRYASRAPTLEEIFLRVVGES